MILIVSFTHNFHSFKVVSNDILLSENVEVQPALRDMVSHDIFLDQGLIEGEGGGLTGGARKGTLKLEDFSFSQGLAEGVGTASWRGRGYLGRA